MHSALSFWFSERAEHGAFPLHIASGVSIVARKNHHILFKTAHPEGVQDADRTSTPFYPHMLIHAHTVSYKNGGFIATVLRGFLNEVAESLDREG